MRLRDMLMQQYATQCCRCGPAALPATFWVAATANLQQQQHSFISSGGSVAQLRQLQQ
jgi:hypothetical protein